MDVEKTLYRGRTMGFGIRRWRRRGREMGQAVGKRAPGRWEGAMAEEGTRAGKTRGVRLRRGFDGESGRAADTVGDPTRLGLGQLGFGVEKKIDEASYRCMWAPVSIRRGPAD